MFDNHVHTLRSPDCRQSAEALCSAAVARGLEGITVTDHADMCLLPQEDTLARIRKSHEESRQQVDKYSGLLRIFCGVELAEYLSDPAAGDSLLALPGLDAVLGSVHSVKYKDWAGSYSLLDFRLAPQAKLEGFLHCYFEHVLAMAEKTDFDVLCHLTCPLRYIMGRFGRSVNLEDYYPEIRQIFRTVIRRGIALEVNTQGLGTAFDFTLPQPSLLRLYRTEGGTLICLGSDAHVPEGVANGFIRAKEMLRLLGFSGTVHFEGRRCVPDTPTK